MKSSLSNHFNRLGGAASAILLATSLSSSAAIIFADNFDAVDGTVGTALNGRTTTTGGGTWLANSIATIDGTTGTGVTTAFQGSAQLGYTFAANNVYTLSIDVVNQLGDGGSWIHLGFSQSPITVPGGGTGNDRFTNIGSVAWMYNLNAASGQVTFLEGPATGGTSVPSLTVPTADHTMSVVLDTTGDGSTFTADLLSNGVSLLTGGPILVDSVTVADLKYAHWGIYGGAVGEGSQVDNFEFSVIPEPSAALLGGLGVLALLRRRRL